ncbi:phosphotransferase family protein [Nocardia stercoris]|uniref:Phosphotransferase family protein n=1 Tax=Nocardia stercoris TaxID=2483361 RepID=A0A3M2L074_9NOCA|nr:phosphotransferase family protein [Nocardia stercoris]RMI30961.1 phosphotransferase family protein [Nocardia stercoris]
MSTPDHSWKLTVSDRDDDTVAARLVEWLATRVGSDAPPRLTSLTKPKTGGMSSATLLFDAEWEAGGETTGGSFVARLAPEASSFPVFETYDLAGQFAVMTGVAAATDIPVPSLHWLETDPDVLGSPFFVMSRVDGRVCEDNPPYVFVGWVFDAIPEERLELTRHTVDVIADIHAIGDPAAKFPTLDGPGSGLRRHFEAQKAWYDWALARDGYRIPLLERAFDVLEHSWPTESGADVLNWGDARPGNILFDGFTPAAVLDWEMAAIGPRELDLAWPILIHRFFQDICTRFDQPGLPDFLRRSDIERLYTERTGHVPQDLDWYLTYAALRHGIVMARIKRRMIHFGEDTDTADRDDYVMHRHLLESLLDGTCEWD